MYRWECPAGPGVPRGPLPNTLGSPSALTTSICQQHLDPALTPTRGTEAKCRLAHWFGLWRYLCSQRADFFPMEFPTKSRGWPGVPQHPLPLRAHSSHTSSSAAP